MFETIKKEELVTATGGLNLGKLPGQGSPINGPTIFNPQGPRPDPTTTDQPIPNPLGEPIIR